MTTTDPMPSILSELARTEVRIRLVGDELEVSAPRGRLSADLRDRIVAQKPDIIRWLAGAAPTAHVLPQVVPDPASADEPFPLSDLQTSFLVGSAEGLEYHVRPHQYMEFDLADLDVERFTDAVNRNLLRQRDNLVALTEDMRLRRISGFTPLTPTVHDFRGLPADEVEQALLRIRDGVRRRELPLDRWPWFDIQISLYGDRQARIHYNNNNFFSDGMGTSRFLENVFGLYRDPTRPLPDLEVSFRDCVVALAEIERSPLGLESEKYWRDRIPEWPDAPAIPLATGAQAQSRSELSRRELVLPADQWTALKKRSRAHGLTDSNVMYAAYAQVVTTWSGSRHFLLNNMVTHRLPLHPQIGEVMGNFASLYPLEVDWRADETFEVRAQKLRAQVLQDMQHVHWSGVKVLQALNQHRRTPGRAACPFVISSGLFMGKFDRPTFSTLETPQVLLDCQFWEQDDGTVWIAWDVIESMFPTGVVDAMFEAFHRLVVGLAHDDAMWQRTTFDLVPEQQLVARKQLNEVPHDVPDGLLHDALAERAANSPDRVAVRTPTATLTYRELHEQSGHVAASLRNAGMGAGSLVPVVLPKGWQQPAAVLGVLEAGGVYVPVDPEWPSERIAHLLQVTEAEHVVTVAALSDRISGLSAAEVHLVGVEVADHSAESAPRRQPQDLAYVIYTSGSTGTPKGAALDHRGPLNTVVDINDRFGIGAGDAVFGISSLCFDLSVYDVFGVVRAGATLVLPDPSELHDPRAWVSAVRSESVTVWNSVPALMQLAVEEAEATGLDLPSLRVVMLSGDWIPVDLPDRIRRVAPNARVISLGGATEASIWSIYHPVDEVDPAWTSIPYGKPLGGQTWHVLDDTGADAPTWVPGHLHIGGVGVAVGYFNDQERTDASFVTHPKTGERLYRTGDLGRYLPDGTIEFLGRADFQVKIQGFRVELGEIEHVMTQHPTVSRALVTVRDTVAGRQLVAFAAGSEVDGTRLREFLGDRLPRYMVPASVTVVDRLPLTANGKVDRRALDALAPADTGPTREFVAPRTELESAVAKIWESVLEVPRVGVFDDFFDLGGQSFAGLRVISQISRQLGRRLSLGALLSGRTVAALCEHLSRPRDWSPLVPLRQVHDATKVFLVHPAGGNVLAYRGLAELVDADWYALQAPGPDSGQEVPAEVTDFAARYVDEIRRVQPQGPYVLGGWSSGAVIAAEVAHQLELLGERVDRLFVFDSPAPMPVPEVDPVSMLLWFLEDLDMGFRADDATPNERAELLAVAEPDRLRAGLALLERRAGRAVAVDEAHLANTFSVFTGVVHACRRHKPTVIGADVLVVRAADGAVSEFAEHPHTAETAWGWHTLTTGTADGVAVPGTHYTLLTDQHVAEVAALVRDHIEPVLEAQR
ncbi:non-ribosomal peptide synthetase [Saccharothrix deserti]|uniref:non-ribosomal peptide synthetase n=1 Tax=Saccharothrix deserti TaxID=2593674 RepID=UPI00131E0B0E|nr:non-ribosomal peptide synthetase [Saccharothrix deserti]